MVNFFKRRIRYLNIAMDIIMVVVAYLFVCKVILGDGVANITKPETNTIIIAIVVYVGLMEISGSYRTMWEYAGVREYAICMFFCLIGGGAISSITFLRVIPIIDLQYNMLTTALIILFFIWFRIFLRALPRLRKMFKQDRCVRDNTTTNLLIIGAGSAGNFMARDILNNKSSKYTIVGLIDDDVLKHKTKMLGMPVLGDRKVILEVCKEKGVNEVLLAIPSITYAEKIKILEILNKTKCKIRILPSVDEIISSKNLSDNIRDVQIEDLLDRQPIDLDAKGIEEYIRDKVVLVTGGGGSIGSELCRQIAKFSPSKLVIFDNYENNAYDIELELKDNYPELSVEVAIASVHNVTRVEATFAKYLPSIIFHAAAHKHVPLMENNPQQAVRNNAFGTLNISQMADKYNVEKFVLISTDKAVNPTNVMGATKRMCEIIIQSFNEVSKTDFVAVRFGNVLGSNGSVIPIFKRQIAKGGPVKVTHKDITRFFMTIPEAAQLVMQAAATAKGGEIFVLDMGKPVKIYDLAYNMIKLSGLEPDVDIKIKITGLRPGEKLYEELLMAEEGLSRTKNKKIFVTKPMTWDFKEIKDRIENVLEIVDDLSDNQIKKFIEEFVPTYKPHKEDEPVYDDD